MPDTPKAPDVQQTTIISDYKIIPDAVCPHCGGEVTLSKRERPVASEGPPIVLRPTKGSGK